MAPAAAKKEDTKPKEAGFGDSKNGKEQTNTPEDTPGGLSGRRPSPLLLAPLLAALLLASAPSASAFSRRLIQQQQHTCELTCSQLKRCITATCSAAGADAGSKLVITLDLSGCRGGAVAWMCCASASCTPRTCNSASGVGIVTGGSNTTCSEASGVAYEVPLGFPMMPIQLPAALAALATSAVTQTAFSTAAVSPAPKPFAALTRAAVAGAAQPFPAFA
ncbi:hypothetical protein GPECTOR_81g220 [Gonium pectorale]|uniref:Uncharacterized protein n=1 Tax=Gonium pectorale TaxID=33097 RepID=A0A150G379_GONPE|nr:hypothetical protein GPECTOR_81g220 [Gonium pectorale]|eukprot:KXZ43770.1 hypothetical protein GPECTOR_81g220 [Gonium pectorale]